MPTIQQFCISVWDIEIPEFPTDTQSRYWRDHVEIVDDVTVEIVGGGS